MYENPWVYNGTSFTDQDAAEFIGFVYLITDTLSSRKYLGKKIFNLRVVRPALKGKNRRRISQKSSDWQNYYGSNDQLKQDVATNGGSRYKREILHLCKSKSQMSYLETKEIFAHDVLINDGWYNQWISCKITRKQLNGFRIS